MNKTNKESWKDSDIAYLCEKARKAKLYDAMAYIRDCKEYLQITDETDLDLMNKMWEITNNREFRKERRRVFPKGTKSIWS